MKFANILILIVMSTLAGLLLPRSASAELESYFVPITPCRLLDTRAEGAGGPFGNEVTRDFLAYGTLENQGGSNDCGIPDTAVAIHVNFTAVNPTGFGYLRAWPFGQDEPGATLMAFTAGPGISNATALAICYQCDFDFNVKIYLAPTDLVADAVGYYVPIIPPMAASPEVGNR
jgi:hypothetical protein